MLSIAPPYLDHALDLPLDFPLDTPLDVATFNDILARVRTCDPLVARDSRLISSANTGRPILQGAALSFDGATQNLIATTSTIDVSQPDWYIEFYINPTRLGYGSNQPIVSQMDLNGIGRNVLQIEATSDTLQTSIGGSTRSFSIQATSGWGMVRLERVGNDVRLTYKGATSTVTPANFNKSDGQIVIGSNKGSSGFTQCNLLDFSYNDGVNANRWDLRDNGLSSLTSGTDLTLVGSPVSVTDNTIPVDPANERGFSGRMLFDGVDDYVRTTSFAGLGNTDSFFYDVTVVTSVLVSQYIVATRNDTTGGLSLALNATGNVQVFRANAQQHTSATSVNDGLKHDIRLEYNGDGTGQLIIDGVSELYTTATTGWADGNDVLIGARGDGVGGALFTFDGIIYNVNINDQASYLGTGNQDSDWLDQIGSNNGIVTGGEYFAALARSDDPSTDVLGNPTQWQGSAYPVRPVERQSSALSFDGVTQYGESPALISSSDTFIHASFWLKPNEPNFAIFFSILHS